MALTAPKPRVRQISTTTGTGTYSLDATVPDAHLGFVAEIGDTNTCHVLVTDSASNGWEWGIYTVADASPDTLARTTVKRSTNGDAAVSWSAGTRTISVIWPPDVTEMLALLGVEAGATVGGGYFLGNSSGATGAVGRLEDIFRVHSDTVDGTCEIASGTNASATGPLTVSPGVTVTVSGILVII